MESGFRLDAMKPIIDLMPGVRSTKIFGLSRYDSYLYNGMSEEANVKIVSTESLPLPLSKPLADNLTLYSYYPLFVRSNVREGVKHFTNTKAAYALNFMDSRDTVVTCHDLIPLIFDEFRGVRKLLFNLSVRGMMKATRIIAISECTKNDVIGYLDYPEERVDVIPQGVDHSKYRQINGARKEFDFLSGEEKVILYVGTDKPTKNLPTLVKAFYRLMKEMPDVRLIKVGRPEWASERRKLLALVDELNLREHITFIDYLKEDKLPLMYNAADLFVFPSLYEGFGLPPLEAMACGCPVVTSNASSLPDVIGDAGSLVDPLDVDGLADAMHNILSNDSIRENLIKKGLERAKLFDWTETAKKTLEVYKKLE